MRRDLVRGSILLLCATAELGLALWNLAQSPNREGSKLVAGVLGAALLGAGAVPLVVYGVRSVRRYSLVRYLRSDGVVAEALVLGMRSTRRPGGRGRVQAVLDLGVTVPGGDPFDATVEETVDRRHIGAIVGTALPVLLDRVDRRTLVVDWEAYESRCRAW
jgi:hypothetical protein